MLKNFFENHFNIISFLIIALAVFGLYYKSLSFDWQYLDDDVLILDKQDYLKFSNIKTIFTDSFFGVPGDTGYRPLLNISFTIDRTFYGTKPFGYHVTNLLIFLFAVFSVYLLFSYKNNRIWSLVFSVIIAVHPVICAIPSRVVDRSDSLLVLFSVLSFYFLWKYIDYSKYSDKTSKAIKQLEINNEQLAINDKQYSRSHTSIHQYLYTSSKKNSLFFCLHFFFFSAALFTKENAIVLPILFLLFSIYNFQNLRGKFSPYLYTFIPLYILIVCVFFFLRHMAVGEYSQSGILFFYIQSIINNFVVLIKYTYNIFFPITAKLKLALDILLFALILLIFLQIFIKTKYKNIKLILFSVFSFVLLLVPTMVMNNSMHSYSQNRLFLPMVCGYYLLVNSLQKYKITSYKLTIVWLVLIIILFSGITYFKIDRFQNKWTAFVAEYEDAPDSPYINGKFGAMLSEIGMYDSAEKMLLHAIELEPNNFNHYNNLAILYMKMERFDIAEKYLLAAQKINPDDENVKHNLQILEKFVNAEKLNS